MVKDDYELSFWEHLDILRNIVIKMLLAVFLCGIVAFCLKKQIFRIALAPQNAEFITYKLLGVHPFKVHLINTGLMEQFMIHMKTAFFFGLLGALPYILYLLYQFVFPALYKNERHYLMKIIGSSYAMFMIGLLVNYFLIFPLTIKFLATYSVSNDIRNFLSVKSYINTLFTMGLVFGIVFEIPIISWILALLGLLRVEWMKRHRKHAIILILIIAAIITPTSDAFTLFIVSLPIWLLYEISIFIVKRTQRLGTDVIQE
jgi:sec-independent protein translocase protein TatC